MIDKKKIILFVLILLVVPVINAEVQTLGNFRKDAIINLIQVCDNCTFVNLTNIKLPDSTILPTGIIMTKNRTVYNYTFDNTNQLGDYIYTTCGDPNGVLTCSSVDFEITPSGKESNTARALFYLGGIILMIFFIMLSFYGFRISQTPSGKLACFFAVWMCFLILFYMAWIGSTNYLYTISYMGTFFKWLFIILMVMTFPMVMLSVVWYFWVLITIAPIKRMLEDGVPEDRAYAGKIRSDLSSFESGGYKPKW